ncbi:ATPase domain-containing protein [Salarchaeum sp. III]|uniref:RAD55 family ATPase n=1 Tax=Salarchaeum sp. III TaxID=3107927 RepID=UPI002EDAFD9C
MGIPTGDNILDRALNGGLPENRAYLVTGGPGTGKSTLAMNFLQAGLERGERCLYISTEQSPQGLREAFEEFSFEMHHENLTITSVHATPGDPLDGEQGELTLETLGEDAVVGAEFDPPFSATHVERHLERFAPADRVVFDSLSGVRLVASSDGEFHRATLDLIRLFSEAFDATSIFTAERVDDADGTVPDYHPSEFKFHGVFRVWRDDTAGEYHRFIEIPKMRGVDHDLRRYELHLANGTIRVVPRNRSLPPEFAGRGQLSTGVDGLDDLLGGGLLRETTSLVTHDGNAGVHALVVSVVVEALANGATVTLVPAVNTSLDHLRHLVADRIGDLDDLFDENRLFVVDAVESDEERHRNVFSLGKTFSAEDVFREIDERRGERANVTVVNTATVVQSLGEERARELRYWRESTLHGPDDHTMYVHDPATMPDELAAFYREGAWQIARTWLDGTGLQYIKLEKSPGGALGSTRLVEYTTEPPYVNVLSAPRNHR